MIENQLFLSCVVPAHNEKDNILNVIDSLTVAFNDSDEIFRYEIIIVDDNSTDGTGDLIDSLAETNLHILPVHRVDTPGFGNAIKAGIKSAKGDIIVPVMGDLSDNPKDILLMVRKISEGYDIVYGSRFIPGGSLIDYPATKWIANRLFNNVVRILFGLSNKDITNAFKAYRKEVFDEIPVDSLVSTGFDLTIEIVLKAHNAGFKSVEIPTCWHNRTAGKANLKLSENAFLYGYRLLDLFITGTIVALSDLFNYTFKSSKTKIITSFILGIILLSTLLLISGDKEIISQLSDVSLIFVILAACSVICSFLFRLWRWRVIYRTSEYVVSRTSLFTSMMAGWLLNYLLPGRIGDISRAFILKGTDNIPIGLSLATVIIERIFDLLAICIILAVAGLIVGQDILYIEIFAIIVIVFLLFVFVLLLTCDKQIGYFDRYIPGLNQSIKEIRKAVFLIVGNYSVISLCIILSFFVWFSEIFTLVFSIQALGFSLPFLESCIAGICGYIVSSLPLTPAGLGVYEIAISGGLNLFSIPLNNGIVISLLDHLIRTIIVMILGLISLVKIAHSLRHYIRKLKLSGEDFN